MKTFLLAVAFLFGATLVTAQEETPPEEATPPEISKTYVGITGGPAFPVGDFYSKSLKNDKAGMAKLGYNLAIVAGFGVTKNFGLGGKFFAAKNEVDKDFFKDSSNVTISPWSYYGLMVGPIFSDAISPSFNMNYKFLFGGGIANTPKVEHKDEVLLARSYSEIQLVWSVSAELQYLFTPDKKWSVISEIGYIDMKPSFIVEEESYSQAIRSVHLSLGIAYQLK